MYKCRGKYEIYLYLHTIYKFTILNSIVSYCTTLTCTININQYHSISFNINQSYLRSLSFAILSLYLSRSHRSGQPDAGALQPRELLPRRQSHLPRRTGRNRRCLEEDPSLSTTPAWSIWSIWSSKRSQSHHKDKR